MLLPNGSFKTINGKLRTGQGRLYRGALMVSVKPAFNAVWLGVNGFPIPCAQQRHEFFNAFEPRKLGINNNSQAIHTV